MSGSPDYPEPTQEERDLQRSQSEMLNEQRDILRQQLREQQLLAPIIYKQLGIKPQYDEAGQITGYEELGPTPEEQAAQEYQQASLRQLRLNEALLPTQLEQQGYRATYGENGEITGVEAIAGSNQQLEREVQHQLLERAQQAMRGELPVDPGLERQFGVQERALREQLRKNLGTGYETSTPGIEALADFNERKANTIYSAQHGEINSATQLALATGQGNNQNFGVGQSVTNPSQSSAAMLQPFLAQGSSAGQIQNTMGGVASLYNGANGLGTLSQLYGNALQPYQQQRQGQFLADVNAQRNNLGGIFLRSAMSEFWPMMRQIGVSAASRGMSQGSSGSSGGESFS